MDASTKRAGGVDARGEGELTREERLELGRGERALRRHHDRGGGGEDGGER